MTFTAREGAVEAIMNCTALNARQRRALLNDTPDADSVLELLALAYATVDKRPAQAKSLIRAAYRLARSAVNDGDAEHAELRVAVEHVEQPAVEEWSKRKVVQRTRPHLEVLVNPILTGQHDEARAAVLAIIAAAGPGMTGSHERPDMRNIGYQLSKALRTKLWDLVAEHQGARSG